MNFSARCFNVWQVTRMTCKLSPEVSSILVLEDMIPSTRGHLDVTVSESHQLDTASLRNPTGCQTAVMARRTLFSRQGRRYQEWLSQPQWHSVCWSPCCKNLVVGVAALLDFWRSRSFWPLVGGWWSIQTKSNRSCDLR